LESSGASTPDSSSPTPATVVADDSDHLKSRRQALGAPGELLHLVVSLVGSIAPCSVASSLLLMCRRSGLPPARLRRPFGRINTTSRFAELRWFELVYTHVRGNPPPSAPSSTASPERSSVPRFNFDLVSPRGIQRGCGPTSQSPGLALYRVALVFSVFISNTRKILQLQINLENSN
jgi:hypothetical protein